ncbi:hypothetical protein lerEdw1_006566, partial [Lerista edwardsae]
MQGSQEHHVGCKEACREARKEILQGSTCRGGCRETMSATAKTGTSSPAYRTCNHTNPRNICSCLSPKTRVPFSFMQVLLDTFALASLGLPHGQKTSPGFTYLFSYHSLVTCFHSRIFFPWYNVDHLETQVSMSIDFYSYWLPTLSGQRPTRWSLLKQVLHDFNALKWQVLLVCNVHS